MLKCIEFAAEAINGLTLLELAGVNSGQPPQVYDWGAGAYSICQIDHEPSKVPDQCFARTSDSNWSDWSASTSGWVTRTTGTSGYRIHDGDMEGWTYTTAFGAPPPSIRFSQVCVSPATSIPPAAVTQPPVALSNTAPPTTPTPAPVVEAPSISPTERTTLTSTGPPTQPPASSAVPAWFFLAATTILLLALGAINFRRRGP